MTQNNSFNSQVIILLGAPGSGKGTQCKRLAADLHIPQISTGDLFRENMAAGTLLGDKARGFIQAGQLVPDQLVLDMFAERVSRSDCTHGYLLDGFPRTYVQAEALNHFLNPNTRMMVLCLEVPDQVIVQRASGRLICKQCGTIYNRHLTPPKQEGICDKCGGEVYQRSDDTPEVVKERLKVYHAQTQPLLEYYFKKNLLTSFNGERSPEEVYQDLIRFIVHNK